MNEPRKPSGADPLSEAEGQAAVEAIDEAESSAADAGAEVDSTPSRRRRKRPAAESSGDAESMAGETSRSSATASDASLGVDLVPVMADEDVVRADSVTITQGGASHVEAGTLNVTQGGIQDARAERIEVRQGGVGRAEVDELVVTRGGVGLVRAEHATIRQGGAGALIGERVDLSQGIARLVIARGSVRLQQAFARTVMARDVEIGERGFAGLVIARNVTGQGRILLDWRAGLALGAGFALVWALLRGRAR
jgi:hypothetical protein